MFFKTVTGRSRRLDDVVEVIPEDRHIVRLRMSDGIECLAHEIGWRHALAYHTRKFIPAEPGTYLLHFGFNAAGEFWHGRER